MTTSAQRDSDPRTTSARRSATSIRGRRVLYVDDEPWIRWETSELLRDAGAICLLAGTHDQAVTLVADEPHLALAILDFQMPDGDVGHLVKRLRAVCARLPLIGTSAIDRRNDFAARGVPRFLEKPWELADLVRVVGRSNLHLQRAATLDPRTSERSSRG